MPNDLQFWISPSQVRAAFRYADGPDDEHTRFFNQVLNSMSGSSLRLALHDEQIESIITGLDVDSRQDRRHDIAPPSIEHCDLCREYHEVGRAEYFGVVMATCPNVPEGWFMHMERGPDGRMQIAGLRKPQKRYEMCSFGDGDGSAPERESMGLGPTQIVAVPAIDLGLSLPEVLELAEAYRRHFGRFPAIEGLPFTRVPALKPTSVRGHVHNCPGCALTLRSCDGSDCGAFITSAAQACADNEFICANCGWSGMPSRALMPSTTTLYCLRCGSTRNTKK